VKGRQRFDWQGPFRNHDSTSLRAASNRSLSS
jgi:hypothetical protein